MTSEHNGRDRRLEDELYVDALLAEAGFVAGSADDDALRDTLLRLRSFRSTEIPAPCAELAALMDGTGLVDGAGQGLAKVIPLAGQARKHPRKKRAVLTSLAVAASLGIAGGAAAGNETIRRHAEGTFDTIVRSFSPPAFFPPDQAPAAPPPAPPAEAPAQPAEAPAPTPDVVLPPAAVQPPGTSAPAETPGHNETPGRAGAGAENRTPAETERGRDRAVPPPPAAQEADDTREPVSSTAPGTPVQSGRAATAAVPPEATEAPQPRVSRGISPR